MRPLNRTAVFLYTTALFAALGKPLDGGQAVTVPLKVADLTVHVIIDGRVALTRVDQTFHNDTPARCEGRYAFVLPPGANLSRYAMYTSETRLVEGEIVARRNVVVLGAGPAADLFPVVDPIGKRVRLYQGVTLGAKESTFMGLAGLGDVIAAVAGDQRREIRLGRAPALGA